jgi:hypothetical protein
MKVCKRKFQNFMWFYEMYLVFLDSEPFGSYSVLKQLCFIMQGILIYDYTLTGVNGRIPILDDGLHTTHSHPQNSFPL